MTRFSINNLRHIITKIAAENPQGFTYLPNIDRKPTRGYAVACIETQDCIGKSGLHKVIKYYLKRMDCAIGGWMNEDGLMQYDATRIYLNYNDAVKAALKDKQRAIFNLSTGREIKEAEFTVYLAA